VEEKMEEEEEEEHSIEEGEYKLLSVMSI